MQSPWAITMRSKSQARTVSTAPRAAALSRTVMRQSIGAPPSGPAIPTIALMPRQNQPSRVGSWFWNTSVTNSVREGRWRNSTSSIHTDPRSTATSISGHGDASSSPSARSSRSAGRFFGSPGGYQTVASG